MVTRKARDLRKSRPAKVLWQCPCRGTSAIFISISTGTRRSSVKMPRLALLCISFLLLHAAVEGTNGTSPNSEPRNDPKKEETFHDVEMKMKSAVGAAIKKLLPQMMKGGMGTISGSCASSIIKIIGGFRQLREWAIRFIDSSGKLPPGILEGTSISLGDFDECLSITVGKKDKPPERPEDISFAGQYCLIESHQPQAVINSITDFQNGNKNAAVATTKTFFNIFIRYKHLANSTFKLGLCIPSKCTKDDLQNILRTEALQVTGKMEVAYCMKNTEIEMTIDQKIVLGIFGFIFLGLLVGTSTDVYSRLKRTKSEDKVPAEKSRFYHLLLRSLSIRHNCSGLLRQARESHEPLSMLCGLRTLTVMSVIYGHTYGHVHELHFQKFSKPANFIRFFNNFAFSGVANTSLAMDTFVFIAAVSITYSRWREAALKRSVKLRLPELLIQTYCRLSFGQLLAIGLFLLAPLFGSGPLWPAYVGPMLQNCQERWWLNILYIGNFWSSHKTCLYHTWILAVLMQLIVLSTGILWILKRSPRSGYCFMLLLTVIGMAGVAFVTLDYDLPGGMAFFMHNVRTGPFAWRNIYLLAYDHVGPFCIGLLTGYFLATKQHCFKLKKPYPILIWCISIICNASVIFGLYRYRNGLKMDTTLSVLYAVTHRNVWAIGIAWLIIACTTGYGGAVSKLLNARVFRVLDSLSFMAFLLHIPIMYYHSGILRERWFMGHMELTVLGIAYITFAFVLSFIVYITCASPYFFFESHLRRLWQPKPNEALEERKAKRPVALAQRSESVDTCISVISLKTGL